jgi:hypothetical protein
LGATGAGFFITSTINSPGSNTPWSITIGGFGKDTTVWFTVHGSPNDETVSNYQNYIDWWTPDGGKTHYFKRTIKNQNVTGIVLNVGNITPGS